MQVVIKSHEQDMYLRRKQSYHQTTWTRSLQEAQVLSEKGAEKTIAALKKGYWIRTRQVLEDTFITIPVILAYAPT